ncbi:uncharacterized protein METZ01_LOCUS67144 [marine metagenome]|uniref:Methylated-DNA-[protein]-cysteine S-methyltransferase DNA binding domain-containing protein n=1 Tax=marine metagenome TaxID=408172 RepID=A0A381TDX1_9ZZZZ
MINKLSFKTSFGWISAEENNNKIISISFGRIKEIGSSKELKKLKKILNNYFLGKNKKLQSNILMKGTKLQIKIWKELQKIPYGQTKSYGDIAKKIKTSPRYVGNVCGQNKHLLLVPCHRVVRSDGQLGGFSGLGGLKLKQRLLNLENSLT